MAQCCASLSHKWSPMQDERADGDGPELGITGAWSVPFWADNKLRAKGISIRPRSRSLPNILTKTKALRVADRTLSIPRMALQNVGAGHKPQSRRSRSRSERALQCIDYISFFCKRLKNNADAWKKFSRGKDELASVEEKYKNWQKIASIRH